MLSIQVIGSSRSSNIVKVVIDSSFPNLCAEYYHYTSYTDAPNIVKGLVKQADIILFTGFAPYQLSKELVAAGNLCAYIPDCNTFLLKALLVAHECKLNTTSISLDTYSQECVGSIYAELDIDQAPVKIYPVAYAHFNTDNHKVLNDHLYNYHVNKAGCCMTQVYSVYEQLRERGIPCVHLAPTASRVIEILHNSILEYGLQKNANADIVALQAKIDNYDEHSVYYANEYQQTLNRGIIAQNMYLFAQQLNGAIVESSLSEFWLFTTDAALRNGTSNLKIFNFILEMPHTLSIGIGYGDTLLECKQAANRALSKSLSQGGNKIYLAKGKTFTTQIAANALARSIKPQYNIDNTILAISNRTGISTGQLFKLVDTIEREQRTVFTSSELAILSRMNPRTVNRMLDKLEIAGYCMISGKKITAETGRPSRVFSFNLTGLLANK